jgi:N-methylhydantoinase B
MDPVTVELVWSRLLSVTNEQQAALVRTGFSTVLRESEDLACGVFDPAGRMIAQSTGGAPGHINSMATGVRHVLAAFEAEGLDPGDVLITNDPWLTAGQINDLTIVSPVFRERAVVGYFASTCHAPDIGGRILSAEASDVFEEGLRLPIMKLARGGEMNEDLLAIVRANVRTPDETVGDIYAQIVSNEVGARSLLALLDEFRLESIDDVAQEIFARSERAMRDAIAALPPGEYRAETFSDGVGGEPLHLVATVRVDQDELEVDYAGSSPQTTHGINVVLNYTHAYTSFAMKALLTPEVPHNDGSFQPVRTIAPEGCVLNCAPPAPVASRHLVGHLLPGLIFQALLPALPDRVVAGGSEALWITVWRGLSETGDWFTQTLFNAGGMGARAGRDGLNATCFPSGVAAVPAEVTETLTPLVVHERSLREGSAGAGRIRGGHGQRIRVSNRAGTPWSVSAMVDRLQFAPRGLEGGLDGAVGKLALGDGRPLPPKRQVALEPDATVELLLPGGAGRGAPHEREPERVLADVVDGFLTIEEARSLYGVAITGAHAIDAAETDRLRGRA